MSCNAGALNRFGILTHIELAAFFPGLALTSPSPIAWALVWSSTRRCYQRRSCHKAFHRLYTANRTSIPRSRYPSTPLDLPVYLPDLSKGQEEQIGLRGLIEQHGAA